MEFVQRTVLLAFFFFFSSHYFHCSWQKKGGGALDPSHNGKLKLCNVNQVFSREQLISFSLKKKVGEEKGTLIRWQICFLWNPPVF